MFLNMEDNDMRAFLRMRYLERLIWTKIRKMMRIKYVSSDTLRMRIERFLKKIRPVRIVHVIATLARAKIDDSAVREAKTI